MAGLEVPKPMLQSLCQARVLKVLVRHHGRFGVLENWKVPKNSRQLLSVLMYDVSWSCFQKTPAFDRRVCFLNESLWFIMPLCLTLECNNFLNFLPHCFPPWDFSPTDSPSRRLWLYCFLRNRTNENFFFTCHGDPWGRVQVAWLHPHRTACMYTTDFLMISLPAWFLQSCRSNRFVIEHASNMQSLLAYQLIRLNRRNPLQKLNRTYFCCTRWNH